MEEYIINLADEEVPASLVARKKEDNLTEISYLRDADVIYAFLKKYVPAQTVHELEKILSKQEWSITRDR
jgi:hypothetical protein